MNTISIEAIIANAKRLWLRHAIRMSNDRLTNIGFTGERRGSTNIGFTGERRGSTNIGFTGERRGSTNIGFTGERRGSSERQVV